MSAGKSVQSEKWVPHEGTSRRNAPAPRLYRASGFASPPAGGSENNRGRLEGIDGLSLPRCREPGEDGPVCRNPYLVGSTPSPGILRATNEAIYKTFAPQTKYLNRLNAGADIVPGPVLDVYRWQGRLAGRVLNNGRPTDVQLFANAERWRFIGRPVHQTDRHARRIG